MYSMHKAKTHLSKLVRDALKGKEVIIARRNEPMVRLVPVCKSPKKRVPGSLKGKIWYAPDAFDPLSADELAEWGIE
jgi:prevent-host-death family protein